MFKQGLNKNYYEISLRHIWEIEYRDFCLETDSGKAEDVYFAIREIFTHEWAITSLVRAVGLPQNPSLKNDSIPSFPQTT